jgi:hypothetical protein
MQRGMQRGATPAFAMLAVTSFALMTLRQSSYGMLGADSYPILLTSRVHRVADVIGNFTERLMDGRFPGAFWRPIVNWSFAVDEWIWGLEPFGYQLTNVLLWSVGGVVLWLVVRELSGSAWTALAAAFVYLLSPVHAEALPVPARRVEYLCVIFMLGALALARRSPLAAGVATLAAAGSKEPALALPFLVFVALRMQGAETSRALRGTVPSAIAALAMLASRTAVLGGLEGHAREGVAGIVAAVPAMARMLLLPQPSIEAGPGAKFVVALVTLGGAVAVWLAVESRGAATARGARRTAGLALAWLVFAAAAYALGGAAYWHRVLPLVGWAMLVAGVCHACVAAARERGLEPPLRAIAVVTLAGATTLAAWHAAYSPLVREYDEWRRASDALALFLDETRSTIENGEIGAMVEAAPLPFWAEPSAEGPVVCSAVVMVEYSLQAWVELAFPQRAVRVATLGEFARRPAADEQQLMVVARRDGFKGPRGPGNVRKLCAGPSPYTGIRPR